MTLLEPAPAPVPGFGGLSRAARRAVGSEAILIVAAGREVVDHHGLEPSVVAARRSWRVSSRAC
jgi:hypothetical protein